MKESRSGQKTLHSNTFYRPFRALLLSILTRGERSEPLAIL